MIALLFAEQKLIRKASEQLREILAIYMLVFHLTQDGIQDIRSKIDDLATMSKASLRNLLERRYEQLKGMRKHYGVKAPTNELLRILQHVEQAPTGKGTLITKYSYVELFSYP